MNLFCICFVNLCYCHFEHTVKWLFVFIYPFAFLQLYLSNQISVKRGSIKIFSVFLLISIKGRVKGQGEELQDAVTCGTEPASTSVHQTGV